MAPLHPQYAERSGEGEVGEVEWSRAEGERLASGGERLASGGERRGAERSGGEGRGAEGSGGERRASRGERSRRAEGSGGERRGAETPSVRDLFSSLLSQRPLCLLSKRTLFRLSEN